MERSFTEKAEEMLKTNSLFDFSNWRIVHYLLECFDSDYKKDYLTKAFKNEKNVVLFLAKSVSVWVGSGTEYEVKDNYQEYLNDEQIARTIDSLKSTGELFQMTENIQNICGAYYLKKVDNSKLPNWYINIPQAAVDKLLSTWKAQLQ